MNRYPKIRETHVEIANNELIIKISITGSKWVEIVRTRLEPGEISITNWIPRDIVENKKPTTWRTK